MTYQISIKDVRNAIESMTSNKAELICRDTPRVSLGITILTREDGAIYTKPFYQIGNNKVELKDNMPIKVLVREFNAAMLKFDQEND